MEPITTSACTLAEADPRRCPGCGALRPANRRRYCSRACARRWADQHVWASARLHALDAAGWRCEQCGADPLELHVHHRLVATEPYSTGCWNHAEHLEVACSSCHRAEHTFLREVDRWLAWAEAAEGPPTRQMELPISA